MKIPSNVRVGAYDVEVATPGAVEMEHNEVEGRFLNSVLRIELRDDRPKMFMRETLLHEILHAVICLSGTRAVLDLETEDEEKLITLLTPALLCVLRDNPDVVRFLTK